MATFETAQAITGKTEIGYNPGRGEAETLDGIDRSQNPQWAGWPTVDAIKKEYPGASIVQLDKLFAANKYLQSAINVFYIENYWNALNLSEINDQQIANNCYDCGVNQGTGFAAFALQSACNLNGAEPKLTIDRQIGKFTIAAVNSLPAKALYYSINTLRRERYESIIAAHPQDEQWRQSWLDRLIPYQV